MNLEQRFRIGRKYSSLVTRNAQAGLTPRSQLPCLWTQTPCRIQGCLRGVWRYSFARYGD